MMYIVVKETKGKGGNTHTIPKSRSGAYKVYYSVTAACDQLVWLESEFKLPPSNNSVGYKVYSLTETAVTSVHINNALKRVGIVNDSEGNSVPREVYDDLVGQNQALTHKVRVMAKDHSDLESERDLLLASHKQKAIDLDVAYDKLERISKLAEED